MASRWGFVGSFLALAGVAGLGCAATDSVDSEASEISAASELAMALRGQRIDPGDVVGTYDLVPDDGAAAAPELTRLILLRDGTMSAPALSRHPYDLVQTSNGGPRFLVIRTTSSDPAPLRVYALERASDPESVTLTFRELRPGGSTPRFSMRRLPCSETMYEEQTAESACAYYQCKLDLARSPAERCSYFEDFGLPYCKKYFRSHFDDHAFGPRVRQCLQEAIRDTMEGLTCAAVEDAALRSHVDCYVGSGYCELSHADKFRIVREVEPKDFNVMNGRTFLHIEKACRRLHGTDL
jgi:hypothetical protein